MFFTFPIKSFRRFGLLEDKHNSRFFPRINGRIAASHITLILSRKVSVHYGNEMHHLSERFHDTKGYWLLRTLCSISSFLRRTDSALLKSRDHCCPRSTCVQLNNGDNSESWRPLVLCFGIWGANSTHSTKKCGSESTFLRTFFRGASICCHKGNTWFWTWTSVAQIFSSGTDFLVKVQIFSSRYRFSRQGTDFFVKAQIFLSRYRKSSQVQKFSSSSENWWWKLFTRSQWFTVVLFFITKNDNLVYTTLYGWSRNLSPPIFWAWWEFLYLTRKSVPWQENLYPDKIFCTWPEFLYLDEKIWATDVQVLCSNSEVSTGSAFWIYQRLERILTVRSPVDRWKSFSFCLSVCFFSKKIFPPFLLQFN